MLNWFQHPEILNQVQDDEAQFVTRNP